jgi:hypothetical protein
MQNQAVSLLLLDLKQTLGASAGDGGEQLPHLARRGGRQGREDQPAVRPESIDEPSPTGVPIKKEDDRLRQRAVPSGRPPGCRDPADASLGREGGAGRMGRSILTD